MTTAIVLAGGASSRFGGDKLAATLDGRPLLHHALSHAAAVADRLVIVIGTRDEPPALPSGVRASATLVRDPAPHRGPLAGLAAGLAHLDPSGDVVLVVAGDMPGVHPAVLALLAETVATTTTAAAARLAADRIQPLPMALRPDRATPRIDELLAGGERGLRAVFDALPTTVVPAAAWRLLDPEGETLRDVDTPDDLARVARS